MPSATAVEEQDTYIGLSEAARKVGRSPTYIMKAVIRGEIRTLVRPGITPGYSLSDVTKLASTLAPRTRRSATA